MFSLHFSAWQDRNWTGLFLFILVFFNLTLYYPDTCTISGLPDPSPTLSPEAIAFQEKLKPFAKEHGLKLSDWPDALLEAAGHNPEMETYVMQYPLEKDVQHDSDMSEFENSSSVPLLLQWDARWGYASYAQEPLGLSGCGPVCLSMVSIYLLQDTRYTPLYMAQFSEDSGYSIPGGGSSWALISEGGRQLGMCVEEIPLDRGRIFRELKAGNPVICAMGPGDFTTTGHFIVMTGCQEGKIEVNDPNSRHRSELLWDYDAMAGQIKNLWAFS